MELVSEHGEHAPLVSWFSKHSTVSHGDMVSMGMACCACSLVSWKLENLVGDSTIGNVEMWVCGVAICELRGVK